jgi:hypothetical protein
MSVTRPLVFSIPAMLAACASTPPDPNRPIDPACDQSANCFYERDIRSFRVLDNRTVVVLVGRNECPFKLEVDGFFCDLTISSFLAFNDSDGRICTWDRSFVASGPFIRDDEYCRVQQITPLTDDELLEAYATNGIVPPLPAKGSGELEVVEDDAPTAPASEEAGVPDPATAGQSTTGVPAAPEI